MVTVATTWHQYPAVPPRLTDPRVEAVNGDETAGERLWRRYQQTGPWIDPEERVVGEVRGHRVTVLAPKRGPATALVLHTITDRHREDLRPALLHDVPGTGVRAISLHLPSGLTCSYGLATLPTHLDASRPGRQGWRAVLQATRPDVAPAPCIGHPTGPLSLLALPGSEELLGWAAPCATDAQRPAVRGTLTSFRVPAGTWPEEVSAWTYQSAQAHGASRAVLVLLDGETWVEDLGVVGVLDAAVAAGALPPLTAVLPASGRHRSTRLGLDDRWADWLATDLLTTAAQHAVIVDDPTRSVVAGQSLGGAAALHAALRHPERFRAVVPQSGAFWWPTVDGVDTFALNGLVDHYRGPRLCVRHQVGTLEFHLLDLNRKMVSQLRHRGHDVSSHEDVGGHDAALWRPGLVRGLAELLAPGCRRAPGEQ